MSLRKIAQLGEPVLRRRAAPLSVDQLCSAEVQRLIDDMIDTMRDADGVGIAAPQVFEPVRLCVIEVGSKARYPSFPDFPLSVLANPELEMDESELSKDDRAIRLYEGCLSVVGLRGRVRRAKHVIVRALDRSGDPLELHLEGIPAVIVQHEFDHLNGTLYVDRAETRTLAFEREYARHVRPEERVLGVD